jgi:hypothetical protein
LLPKEPLCINDTVPIGDGLANPHLFGDVDDPETTESLINRILKEVWESDNYKRCMDGLLGTHSVRKFPSSFSRRNGCTKDNVDSCG